MPGLRPETVRVTEPVTGPSAVWSLRPLDHALLAQRAAGGDEPLLPLLWGLWFLLGVDQQLPACRTAVILGFEQLQGVCVQRRGVSAAANASPRIRPQPGGPGGPPPPRG